MQLLAQPESAFDAAGLTLEAADLDAGACADTLRECGVTLVRGVVPRHLFPDMIEDVEGYFRWLASGQQINEAMLYSSFGNIFFATVAAFGKQSLLNLISHAGAPPLRDAVYDYFQADRVAVFMGYSFIRRHWRTDTMSISPFHQDSTAVPVPAPMLTCWIPLNRCGLARAWARGRRRATRHGASDYRCARDQPRAHGNRRGGGRASLRRPPVASRVQRR